MPQCDSKLLKGKRGEAFPFSTTVPSELSSKVQICGMFWTCMLWNVTMRLTRIQSLQTVPGFRERAPEVSCLDGLWR